ncbi:hypothetical protein [Massilia sp. S19_KUP03_FR1]|uniref:hypothetical protein n=1 Tax=Massilia sp. S19_KUP03_FR1 TaxID=3025503 RepID=UPI002FCD95B3
MPDENTLPVADFSAAQAKSDPSAQALAAAGHAEGLLRDKATIPWFDGQPRQFDRMYIADGRVAALCNFVTDGHESASVYGDWVDGIVTRGVDGSAASFVAGQWLSGGTMVGQTLLSQALADFLPMLDGAPLQVDDCPVLGQGNAWAGAAFDAQHWSVAVSGELALPGLVEPIALRPTSVTLADDVLSFEEPGVAPAAGQLVLAMTLGQDAAPDVTLAMPVALLLDEKIDGAWERASPLWLPTSTGLLRVQQDDVARAPYRFFGESRHVDVRGWFPQLGAAGHARLMLDQSGRKTFSVRKVDGQLLLTLAIDAPALVLVLDGMAVDGRSLDAAQLPPGAAAMARAASLQLVPLHLCGAAASPWQLACNEDIVLTCDAEHTATLTHFTGASNWVLPPEAARNDAPGISPLRTLIPLQADGAAHAFVLRAHSGMLLEPRGGFSKIAPEAFSFGPLASFDPGPGLAREQWSPAVGGDTGEPAVLRALYRMLPPGVASDGAPASFDATRVQPGAAPAGADVAPMVHSADQVAQQQRWAWRPAGKHPELRSEHRSEWPGARFGWSEVQFLLPAAMAAMGAPPTNPALAWGELRSVAGGEYAATRWVRLSDDSLAPLPAMVADGSASALQALADPVIVLTQASLADDEPVQKRWGLAQLQLVERIEHGESTFTLLAGAAKVEIALAGQHGVNRIVLADARTWVVKAALAPAVATATLNRIYLELERRGGRLVVVRGMLGWGATAAFGWNKKGMAAGDPQFHVTERFERTGDVLLRSVEYNGTLARQLRDKQAVELYFWDAVQAPMATTLRVICHYRLLQSSTGLTSICALQDAALTGEGLDLSADIAMLRTNSVTEARRLANPWEPDRRKLYRLLFDTMPAIYSLAGFLRIRSADLDKVVAATLNPTEEARIVPAWFLCDRDVIPCFNTDRALPAPSSATWTAAGALRSGPPAPPKTGLAMQLFTVPLLDWAQCYAATLVGNLGPDAGIPLWVPSPVRVPPTGVLAPEDAPVQDPLRLWLFNPGPRLIAEWPLPDIADADLRRTTAQQQAVQRLWRMGWTREAVLEVPPLVTGAGDVAWLVVASPLQNRGASVAWFGWPLAPGAEYPVDQLPATEQVPHTSSANHASYSLQVAFKHDLPPAAGGVNLVADSGHPGFDNAGPTGLTVRASGIRVGVQHKLAAYGPVGTSAQVASAPLAMPARQHGAALAIDGEWLAWRTETVNLQGAGLAALGDGVLLCSVPAQWSAVQISDSAPGLAWLNGEGNWAAVGASAWMTLAPGAGGTSVIRLRLPARSRWQALAITLRTAAGLTEARTLFPAGGIRLAGVFDADGKLLAFGEEHAFYRAPARPDGTPAEQSLFEWTRESGVALPAHLALGAARVATIDLDGQVVDMAK